MPLLCGGVQHYCDIGYRCRHAHDGVSAGAVGEAHGCSRSQPVHIPLRGHHQPWKPHQGDKREWHEGETAVLQCIRALMYTE